jgi:hypothetical protein
MCVEGYMAISLVEEVAAVLEQVEEGFSLEANEPL